MTADISAVETRIKAEMAPHFEKSGDVFEIIVRQEMRRTKGEDYGRSFVVRDLVGLARLAAPKNKKLDGTAAECADAHFLLDRRAAILAIKAKVCMA